MRETRALADERDTAAADGAVDGVLRLAVDGDGHLVADPAAAQAAAQHRADGAGLALDLRVGGALGATAEDHECEQQTGEHAGDDPEGDREAVALAEPEPEADARASTGARKPRSMSHCAVGS